MGLSSAGSVWVSRGVICWVPGLPKFFGDDGALVVFLLALPLN